MASGTLLPLARLTALDANGNPLPGAKLTVYLAGTSTPATTYSDVTLGSANTNPVISSSSGIFPPIYLASGSSVKLLLTTAADVLVWTQDNVPAVPGVTSAPTVDNAICQLRLTLTNGTPVTTADVTAATAVYVNPYAGDRIALYSGSEWNVRA